MTCILTENVTYPQVLFTRFLMQNICTLFGLKILNKGRANRKWRRDNVRSRRLSNHKWRRIPTLTWRRNVVAAEMLIQRRSHVALRRLNNLLSTSFVVVLTLIQRCLDVAMRRWNNVVFWRRINISIATYRDVIPTSEFNVGTTLIRRLCVCWDTRCCG